MNSHTEQYTLFNEHQAAEYLTVSVSTLQQWRWKKTGPSYRKIGGAVRYALTDLTVFLEESKRS